MTALHYSLILGYDEIAADIIDASFQEDLEISFGLGNTALHLATLVGSQRVVKLLLDRGCNRLVKNRKG
jgi:ankyrin repeat protein